jgi:hypothetical protein
MSDVNHPLNHSTLRKRYVYDLSETVRQLDALGDFTPPDQTSQAWIVEHLRSHHLIDVDELDLLTRRSDIRKVDERCGRVPRALTKSLYRMFYPMTLHAMEAAFTDIHFKHNVLTVMVYDYA